MLWQKNNGTEYAEVLQNQFSAYVKRAVYHRRLRYLSQKSKRESHETGLCDYEDMLSDSTEYLHNFEELDTLRRAMRSVREKERRIILAHLVEEKSFVEIALELDMTYKAVTCLYYRVMRKLRESMEGGEIL